MDSFLLRVLQNLCLTPSPSGFEEEIAKKLTADLLPFCDRVELDPHGNVVGIIKGKDSSLRPVLINAHMDRVGFIVSMISDDGYLILCEIGTPNIKVLPGLTLAVRKTDKSGWINAAVGTKCAHLMDEADRVRAPKLSELMIDVGQKTAQDVRKLGIDVGSPVVFTPTFSLLAGTRVCGTAMDNCGSVAAMVGVARILQSHQPERDVYLAGNVWEEYNQRGTTVLVRQFNPIAVISMDMLLAGDTPDVRGHFHGSMGEGPMASCYNYFPGAMNGCIAHEGLFALAEEVAQDLHTGIQRYVCVGGYGDNAYAQLETDGPACIEIGAAVRYAHSSCEVTDLADIKNLSILVAGMAVKIDADFDHYRYRV